MARPVALVALAGPFFLGGCVVGTVVETAVDVTATVVETTVDVGVTVAKAPFEAAGAVVGSGDDNEGAPGED